MCWNPEACNFIKKRLQHRCFPVKFVKFLRTPTLKNICERLLTTFFETITRSMRFFGKFCNNCFKSFLRASSILNIFCVQQNEQLQTLVLFSSLVTIVICFIIVNHEKPFHLLIVSTRASL